MYFFSKRRRRKQHCIAEKNIWRQCNIVVLMSVEIMLTAANINFIAFSSYYNDLTGQIVALFVTTIAAAEVAIGLAILLSLFKQRDTIELDLLNRLRW